MRDEKKCLIGVIFILIIFTIIIKSISNNNSSLYRNVKKSVEIKNKNLLKHELKTNEGFKVLITGKGQNLKPITNVEYLKKDKEFLYLEKITERYTRHTSTTTDSKGHTHTRTHYTWDICERDIKKANEIKILDHSFKKEFDFNNIDTLNLKGYINNKWIKNIENNYIYLDRRIITFVGDKRIHFKGIKNNSKITLAGEISNKSIKPYNKFKKVFLFKNNKKYIIEYLKYKTLKYKLVFCIGSLIIIIVGVILYKK